MKQLFLIITGLSFFQPVAFSQSAIGQLEYITGQTIDRGSYSGDYDAPTPVADQAYYNGQYANYLAMQAHDENEKGIAAYNKGDWSKAAAHFNKAQKLNPELSVYAQNYKNAKEQADREEAKKREEQRFKTIDKTFLSNYNKDIKSYSSQLKSLRKTIASYVPPLGTPTRTVKEGLILGLFNVQSDYAFKNIESPTGHKFTEGEYYATSDNKTMLELVRGVVDNYTLGKYTLNSDWGKQLVSSLAGTHFERLYAHSNGATISEALIREGTITVDELHIMGGDRSYMNFQAYEDLVKSGKINKIVIWYNPGDIIPKGSSVKLLHPEKEFNTEYQKIFNAVSNHKLIDSNDGKIQYRKLEGKQYKGQNYQFNENFFEAHNLDTYFYNIRQYNKNMNTD
jgi:tetratricopeptide (TPR) repeat protein